MTVLTLVLMRTAVLRNLGALSTDGDALNLEASFITDILNEANHSVETERDWPWLGATETISTVSGTRLYTPAAGWLRTKALTAADWGPLKVVSQDDLAQAWPTTTDLGTPVLYAEVAGQLDLRPTPNGVYTLTHSYFRTEPELSSDSDTPLLPNQFRGRLVDMATAMAAARLRIWAVSQYHQSKDAAWQRRMADDTRRTLGTKRVRVRDYGPWGRAGI